MLCPIKPIKSNLFSLFINIQPSLKGLLDNKSYIFNNSLSTVRIGKTFKTSSINRIPLTSSYIYSLKRNFKKIHDIGSSDGTSSYELIKNLKFDEYILMDKYLYLYLFQNENKIYLFDHLNNLHMYENDNYKLYLDPLDQSNSITEIILNLIFKSDKLVNINKNEILCINKEILKLNKNIKYEVYDLFEEPLYKNSDLILITNLIHNLKLNKKTLAKIKKNILNMASDNCLIVIGENTDKERTTFLRYRNNNLFYYHSINGGSVSKKFIKYLLK